MSPFFKKSSAAYLFFLISFVSENAFASSEAAMWIPWTVLRQKVEKIFPAEPRLWREELADQTLSVGGLQWKLAGLRADFQLERGAFDFDGRRVQLQIPHAALRLTIGSLAVDQIIEREVNGIIARVHLQAQCGPFRLSQDQAQADTQISLNWKELELQSRIDALDLQWGHGSWTLSEIACSGPAGFDVLLQQEVTKQLQTPEAFRPILKQVLGQRLQATIDSALSPLKNLRSVEIPGADQTLNFQALHFDAREQGLAVLMKITTTPEVSLHGFTLTPEIIAGAPADRPSLHFPQGFLNESLETWWKTQPAWTSFDLQKIGAFRSLMNSRFLQFFLWPDLWNYAKTAPFTLKVKRPENLSMQWSANGEASFSSELIAWMQSSRAGKIWDYVWLRGQATTKLNFSFASGLLKIRGSILPRGLSTGYGPDYRARFGWSGWLPGSILNQAAAAAAPSLSYDFAWPDLDLGDGGKYRATQLRIPQDGIISLDWEGL